MITTSTDELLAALTGMYAQRGDAAVAAIAPFLADDFTFVPAGTTRSELQAQYVGAAGFATFLRRQSAWTTDTWWPEVQQLRIGLGEIVAVVHARPTRTDGLAATFVITHRWAVFGGRITGFRSETADKAGYDRFHTRAAAATPSA